MEYKKGVFKKSTFNGSLEGLFLFVDQSVLGLEGLSVQVLSTESGLSLEHLFL